MDETTVHNGSHANTDKILTVSQLNEYIKMLLDGTPLLKSIFIKGEISNFTNHYKTGHLYFTLKDADGTLKCVMFKSSASKLKFMPENGMRVIAHGRVTAFVRDGQYLLYADSIEPDGVGALYIAYEQLKRRLEAEGLFSEAVKRPLPKIPTRIGVITSPTGAAVRDMMNILGRRFPLAEIVLYPALVQGPDAAPQLIDGVRYFSVSGRADVVIIGRGGGSIEDLWAFNDENLARAIRASSVPVISAVGHETDFTICDFASDKRAPTPSAAAELAVPDTPELRRKINNIVGRMELLTEQRIAMNRQRLQQLAERRVLTSPANIIDDKRMAALSLEQRLVGEMQLLIGRRRTEFVQYTAKLEALDPLAIIARGYSAVFKKDGELIKSVRQVAVGDEIRFKTSDGEVGGIVQEVMKAGE